MSILSHFWYINYAQHTELSKSLGVNMLVMPHILPYILANLSNVKASYIVHFQPQYPWFGSDQNSGIQTTCTLWQDAFEFSSFKLFLSVVDIFILVCCLCSCWNTWISPIMDNKECLFYSAFRVKQDKLTRFADVFSASLQMFCWWQPSDSEHYLLSAQSGQCYFLRWSGHINDEH